MAFDLEKDFDKVFSEVKKIAYENRMSKGFDITIKIRCDEPTMIDFSVIDRIVKTWEG